MNAQAPSNSDECLDVALLDKLWDFDDPAASERRFRQAIDEVPVGSTRSAELTTQLARSIGLQGRYDEASALLDTVDAVDGTESAAVVVVRSRLERGRLANSTGDSAAAVELLREALARAESAGAEFLAIDAAHMLAIVDGDRADEWTALALRLITSAQDPRAARWAGSVHNNAGWSRHDAGDYTGALAEFESARAAYSVHGTVEQVRVARWAVARALRSLARFDEALDIQRQLAEQGPADGYVEEELAELLLATGDRAKAAQHAAAAARLLGADSWFAEYESGRLDRLRQLAQDG
jgi:tetratricopeptide (TPR) repeat protein